MQRLRELRLNTGRSLKTVAEEVKALTGEWVDPATLSKAERGMAGLPDRKKLALARYWDMSVGALFFGEETEGSSGSEDAAS